MSEKTVNQETNPNPTAGKNEPEKTFTQSQLDAIVADRLKRAEGKYADYEDLKAKARKLDELTEAEKSDLQKAQDAAAGYKAQLDDLQAQIKARDARDKVSAEKGVPAYLLTASTEEDCRKQADDILRFSQGRPKYPDTGDGGEPAGSGGGGATRDQFAEWMNAKL